jgi:hypothetical protein
MAWRRLKTVTVGSQFGSQILLALCRSNERKQHRMRWAPMASSLSALATDPTCSRYWRRPRRQTALLGRALAASTRGEALQHVGRFGVRLTKCRGRSIEECLRQADWFGLRPSAQGRLRRHRVGSAPSLGCQAANPACQGAVAAVSTVTT